MNLSYIDNEQAQGYIASRHHANKGVYVPLAYIDMVNGKMSDAILFSQIMYWHEPAENGQTKLRVKYEDHYWIAKNHSDWFDECRLKNSTVRNALNRLKKLELIHYKVSGYSGNKTPLIRINWDTFINLLKSGRGKNPSIGHNVADNWPISGQPNTETTTETTKEKDLPPAKNADGAVASDNVLCDCGSLYSSEHIYGKGHDGGYCQMCIDKKTGADGDVHADNVIEADIIVLKQCPVDATDSWCADYHVSIKWLLDNGYIFKVPGEILDLTHFGREYLYGQTFPGKPSNNDLSTKCVACECDDKPCVLIVLSAGVFYVCINCYEDSNTHTCSECGKYRMHSDGDYPGDYQLICDDCIIADLEDSSKPTCGDDCKDCGYEPACRDDEQQPPERCDPQPIEPGKDPIVSSPVETEIVTFLGSDTTIRIEAAPPPPKAKKPRKTAKAKQTPEEKQIKDNMFEAVKFTWQLSDEWKICKFQKFMLGIIKDSKADKRYGDDFKNCQLALDEESGIRPATAHEVVAFGHWYRVNFVGMSFPERATTLLNQFQAFLGSDEYQKRMTQAIGTIRNKIPKIVISGISSEPVPEVETVEVEELMEGAGTPELKAKIDAMLDIF